MLPHPPDIFTEPSDVSPDGLANLEPLRRLAGRPTKAWRRRRSIRWQ
jgi:hypothetical protein